MAQPWIDPRRVSAAWPVFTTLAAIVLLAGYLIGAPIYRRGVLRTDIERAVRMFQIGYTPHIALTDFTGFDWTEVHIFPPYSTVDQIEVEIWTRWPRFASNAIETDDSITLLVFMDGDRLVRWVEIGRGIADYSDVAAGSPYTPETAVFIMPVDGQPDLVVLKQ
jgi:hypothetical protein